MPGSQGLRVDSVRNRFRTEAFEFECELISQMQHAALEIDDHQVIRRRISQSFSDLVFEGLVPSFKISNMIRFHDSLRIHASVFDKEKRARLREGGGITWRLPQTLPEGVRSLVEKPKPLKQLASPS